MVMGRDSRSDGRGFEYQHRLPDEHFSHIFVVKIVVKDIAKYTNIKERVCVEKLEKVRNLRLQIILGE